MMAASIPTLTISACGPSTTSTGTSATAGRPLATPRTTWSAPRTFTGGAATPGKTGPPAPNAAAVTLRKNAHDLFWPKHCLLAILFQNLGIQNKSYLSISSLNPGVSFTYGVHGARCPFICMQEKANAACGLFIKWKFFLKKLVSSTSNGPI